MTIDRALETAVRRILQDDALRYVLNAAFRARGPIRSILTSSRERRVRDLIDGLQAVRMPDLVVLTGISHATLWRTIQRLRPPDAGSTEQRAFSRPIQVITDYQDHAIRKKRSGTGRGQQCIWLQAWESPRLTDDERARKMDLVAEAVPYLPIIDGVIAMLAAQADAPPPPAVPHVAPPHVPVQQPARPKIGPPLPPRRPPGLLPPRAVSDRLSYLLPEYLEHKMAVPQQRP